MKKIFFGFIVTTFLAISGFAQTQNNLEKSKLEVCGTAELVNGQAVITFEQSENSKEVVVSLTPQGEFLELFVAVKEKGRIVIKAANASTGKFDYVIYETIIVPAPTNKKQ